MTLNELKELAARVGLCIDNMTTLEGARNTIIRSAKEVVNY